MGNRDIITLHAFKWRYFHFRNLPKVNAKAKLLYKHQLTKLIILSLYKQSKNLKRLLYFVCTNVEVWFVCQHLHTPPSSRNQSWWKTCLPDQWDDDLAQNQGSKHSLGGQQINQFFFNLLWSSKQKLTMTDIYINYRTFESERLKHDHHSGSRDTMSLSSPIKHASITFKF